MATVIAERVSDRERLLETVHAASDLFADPSVWLNTPNSNLGGDSPSDLIERGEGEAVLNLLLLIRHVGLS